MSSISKAFPGKTTLRPTSLDELIQKIDHLAKIGTEKDSLILFRGQINKEWPLDSTFVRNCIQSLFNINDYNELPSEIRQSSTFHRTITSLLLMKFDKIVKPSQEALDKEVSQGIDPYFELFKNAQQYPENYIKSPFIDGTNFIDWTNKSDIALYFTTFEGREEFRRVSNGDGILWAYDASSTGKIHQLSKMQHILDNMTRYEFLSREEVPLPLLFHPPKQTQQYRASNQKPIYIKQMNFSFNLSDVWEQYEKREKIKVFIKIVINKELKYDIAKYLDSKGIAEEHVYPH